MERSQADAILNSIPKNYDRIARHFSQTRQTPWVEFNDLTPLIQPTIHLLDVGCGNGRLLGWLLNQWPQLHYTGVDNSEELMKIAQKHFPNHSFITSSMLQLPLPEEQFDIVACVAALQHIPSTNYRQQALQEMYRVVKPGGRLFMLNWDIYQSKFAAKLTTPPANCDSGDIFIPWKNDQGEIVAERYYHAFTHNELTELCTKTGWQVMTCALSQGGHNIITIAKRE